MPEEVMALGAMFLLMMPFVIFIFTKHQQRMAMILHETQKNRRSEESLQMEIQQLRSLLAQQTILLDSIAQSQSSLSKRLDSEIEFHQRLGA
jgi:hypothetical protein